MEAGEAFTAGNLRAIRPGDGLPPKFLDVLMGRKVGRAVSKGTPASWDLLGDA
jgi:N-acetylneuraminate synthase